MKVFLSHSTKDKEFVQRLADALTGAGFTPSFGPKTLPDSCLERDCVGAFGGQPREVCETLLVDHEKGHRGDL
jgi:hypothetical protein